MSESSYTVVAGVLEEDGRVYPQEATFVFNEGTRVYELTDETILQRPLKYLDFSSSRDLICIPDFVSTLNLSKLENIIVSPSILSISDSVKRAVIVQPQFKSIVLSDKYSILDKDCYFPYYSLFGNYYQKIGNNTIFYPNDFEGLPCVYKLS